MDNAMAMRADVLSAEKLQLGAIRSLNEDDRFRRYVSALRSRYEQTHEMIDGVPADDIVTISQLKGIRNTYQNELRIIDSCADRIKEIDGELSEMKQTTKKTGNEGRHGSAPPKEQ